MLAQTSSVDENTIAQHSQMISQKGHFGSKSFHTNSNHLPKTPSASTNTSSKRRALGDISNRKVHQDDSNAKDGKTEKKLSKLGTSIKSTETPHNSRKDLQETKTIGKLPRKSVNFADQPSVISIRRNDINQIEQSKFTQKHTDVNDDIERLFGRAW